MSLVVYKLCKSFAGRLVLDQVSLTLPEQGVVCINGPSGCGKTTLLRCLAGIEVPDSGTISGLEQCRLAVVFQENRLLPWYDAVDNVAFPIRGDRERARRFLQLMELEQAADKLPSQLSGGMQRRVSLARAMAYGGDALLLDEPTTGLDPGLAERVMDRLLEQWQGRLVILVTHERELSRRYADHIYEADGPPLRELRPLRLPCQGEGGLA